MAAYDQHFEIVDKDTGTLHDIASGLRTPVGLNRGIKCITAERVLFHYVGTTEFQRSSRIGPVPDTSPQSGL